MNIFCRMSNRQTRGLDKLYTRCPLNQDNSPIMFPKDRHFGLKRCFAIYNDIYLVAQSVLKK